VPPTRDTLPPLPVAAGQAARLKALAAAAGYPNWSAFVRAAIADKLNIDPQDIDPGQWGGVRKVEDDV